MRPAHLLVENNQFLWSTVTGTLGLAKILETMMRLSVKKTIRLHRSVKLCFS